MVELAPGRKQTGVQSGVSMVRPQGALRQRRLPRVVEDADPYNRRGGFHIRPGAFPLPHTATGGQCPPLHQVSAVSLLLALRVKRSLSTIYRSWVAEAISVTSS